MSTLQLIGGGFATVLTPTGIFLIGLQQLLPRGIIEKLLGF